MVRVAFKEYNDIIGIIENSYHEAAVKLNLSDSELNILYTMQSSPDGCNQSTLYKRTGLTKSTINTALKKMEKNGVIKISPGEGRNTWVSITAKGQELTKNTVEKIIEIENEIYDAWTEDEQEMIIKLSREYAEKLKEKISHL